MSSRASTAERDDDAIFVENGVPVKFCFHRSVTQGRGQITRDVVRHGGEIVQDEKRADVLLVDEQEDITFIRRRYYHSTEIYRLRLHVEPRGFVQGCVHLGEYRHDKPTRETMPGRIPGRGRGRTAFTQADKDHLAFYIATRFPTRDGRLGMKAYKDLEELARSDDTSWEWARRHTAHSWREHYKKNPEIMDPRIDYYLGQLKDIGHHNGHDPRRHNQYWELREEEEEGEEEEEEEEEESEEERRQGRDGQEDARQGQVRPAVVAVRPAQARDYLARQENNLETFDEEEEEDIYGEDGAGQDLRAKRNATHLHDQDIRAKRARLTDVSSDMSDVLVDWRASTPPREQASDGGELPSVVGSDLFGDRSYESPLEFGDQDIEFPAPFSPRTSPVPQYDGPPLSTQATLVASPVISRKEPTLATGPTPAKVPEARASTPPPTSPPSSPQTMVGTQQRAVERRVRVRGASAQPGPSVIKEKKTLGDVAMSDAPYRNTRARSRSVDPQPQTGTLQRDQGREGKGKAKEEVLVLIDEDVEGETQEEESVGSIPVTGGLSTRDTFEDELAVVGLLEKSPESPESKDDGDEEDEEGGEEGSSVDDNEDNEDEDVGEDGGSMASVDDEEDGEHRNEGDIEDGDEAEDGSTLLPSFQDVGIASPSDSDDAETHARLVRGAEEGSVAGSVSNESEGRDHVRDQGQVQEEDSDTDTDTDDENVDQIDRMASGSLYPAPAPVPMPVQLRVTRSMAMGTHTQEMETETRYPSPPKTRSGRGKSALPTNVFPSPGTKARAVVDRFKDEERRVPYAPPEGSRAARAVGKERRG